MSDLANSNNFLNTFEDRTNQFTGQAPASSQPGKPTYSASLAQQASLSPSESKQAPLSYDFEKKYGQYSTSTPTAALQPPTPAPLVPTGSAQEQLNLLSQLLSQQQQQ